ncbi:retron system putative HNH endonuclease [Aliarcobacter butzleri]
MRKLLRPAELQELKNARRTYASIRSADEAWEKFGDNEDRTKVRVQLESVQDDLCAYCENSLEDNAHIDHFKPKSRNRSLTFEWENLIVSCSHNDSCGNKKANNFQTYWINPYLTDPSEMFKFYSDGQIKGTTSDAEKIIKDFGLDCPRLEEKRKGILSKYKKEILAIVEFPDAFEYFLENEAKNFPTAHKQIVKKLIGA